MPIKTIVTLIIYNIYNQKIITNCHGHFLIISSFLKRYIFWIISKGSNYLQFFERKQQVKSSIIWIDLQAKQQAKNLIIWINFQATQWI